MTGKTTFTGGVELQKALEQLGPKLLKSIAGGSLKKALTPTLNAMIGNAPVGETGNLANSFGIKVSKTGTYAEVKNTNKGFHAHLVEFGHRVVSHGVDTGEMAPPNPFARKAWDSTQDQVLKILIDEIKLALEKSGRSLPGANDK